MRRVVPIALVLIAAAGLSTAVLLTRSPRPADASPRSTARPAACQDQDGDGFGLGCARGPDCNDLDSAVHPGQAETCNFRDDDCNALVDDVPGCPQAPLNPSPVRVPAGAFTMGSPQGHGAIDEQPEHAVHVGAFRIDRYEVTNRRYQQCVQRSSCELPGMLSSHLRSDYFENPRYADYPVVFVTWKQADSYCKWAGGRLPTEPEWEKAAKGTGSEPRTFPWGNEAPDCSRANMGGPGSCVGDTDRVGLRVEGRSPYGAMDMAGNVWEWVSDWYDPAYYASAPSRDTAGPAAGSLKVMRGGCWESGADSLRVSCRKAELPATWAYNIGFRCAYPEGR
ncbi:MAG: SUMF1/EgtB/PvdO family nonheme iron enzyme [Deltaproteobacteria bacterium]|nr:SUMF1/EgtB/PvdO family nonheme iron enzyme [Deltaproteobacteria bacterium]